MLAIQKSKRHNGSCTPNVLPCRINHNGPVNATKRYWNPRKTADGKTLSYFRGRKLYGRALKLPTGFKGVVVSSTDRILPRESSQDHEEEADMEAEVKVLEEEATFEEVMVWGHEVVVDSAADPYVRGVEEWIGFAAQIHSYGEDVVKAEMDEK